MSLLEKKKEDNSKKELTYFRDKKGKFVHIGDEVEKQIVIQDGIEADYGYVEFIEPDKIKVKWKNKEMGSTKENPKSLIKVDFKVSKNKPKSIKEYNQFLLLKEYKEYEPKAIEQVISNTLEGDIKSIEFQGLDYEGNYEYIIIPKDNATSVEEFNDKLTELFDTEMFDVESYTDGSIRIIYKKQE